MTGPEKIYRSPSGEEFLSVASDICDMCGKEELPFVTQFAAIPPDGMYIVGKDIFVCAPCARRWFWNNQQYDFSNVFRDFAQTVGKDNATKELMETTNRFLPWIFRTKRPPFPKYRRQKILRSFGYTCQKCGGKKDLQVHHIKPYSRGGLDDDENLTVLCAACNRKKGNKE